MDPYSTGAMLAPELDRRGYTVLALWTSDAGEQRGHLPQAAKGFPAAWSLRWRGRGVGRVYVGPLEGLLVVVNVNVSPALGVEPV